MNHFDWESQLLEENKMLRQIISDTANEELADASKYKKLKDSVDKAIEELQHIKVYEHTATARLVSLPEVLDVLKKNIGE